MPSWLTEVLKLLGFMTPFVYAAATYGFFHFLDKKASDAAKRALTERLQSTRPPKVVIPNFAVETFDLVYTRPLLHWRAFLRCLSVTAVVSAIVWYELGILISPPPRVQKDALLYTWQAVLCFVVIINTLSAYLSLFFVRGCLVVTDRWPVLGLFVAAIVGTAMICALNLGRDLLITLSLAGSKEMIYTILFVAALQFSEPALSIFLPGFMIHLWLPLFAFAVVLTQMSVWVLKAVDWSQWLLKQGEQHPFQAVGYPAALIVFVIGIAIQA